MGRSRGVKIIKKKINATSDDDMKDLQAMFSQITGTSEADKEVLIPKINKIYMNIIEYNKVFKILLNFKRFTEQFEEYKFWFEDIAKFLDELIKTNEVDITKKYDDFNEHNYHTLDQKEINTFYKVLKDNVSIKSIIITGSRLAAFKKHIVDADNLDDVFINREPGITLQPLAFSTLDLKTIWNTDINEQAKKFILSILRRAYIIGIDMHDIYTSPDVDIKKFSKILVDSISQMKKQIPRCDKAFAIIEKSVSMLEENFKSYFRGSVEAGNPSIIIESFIVDISTSQKASPMVTAEFKRIVSFLQKQSSQTNDPKIKKLFGMLNSQFSVIDTELEVTK